LKREMIKDEDILLNKTLVIFLFFIA
jgi:hypothetical protein